MSYVCLYYACVLICSYQCIKATAQCKYKCVYLCARIYASCFNFTGPYGCPQENDTFAGDYLLQSFQRLAMILANKSEGNDSYQHSNFGKAFVDL